MPVARVQHVVGDLAVRPPSHSRYSSLISTLSCAEADLLAPVGCAQALSARLALGRLVRQRLAAAARAAARAGHHFDDVVGDFAAVHRRDQVAGIAQTR